MSKRPLPFDDCIGRQLKVHLYDYENDERALKDIQEKTVTMLIEGSRRFYSGELKVHEESTEEEEQPLGSDIKASQRFITDYFRQM
ncbi:hypothetical protein RUM44_004318 [Polyplax serrata]|uniref:Uncharacterized protein n=1 Tax=Polyplax serrata TaxID=468196 RepID=A0ABR1B2H2_POLSC